MFRPHPSQHRRSLTLLFPLRSASVLWVLLVSLALSRAPLSATTAAAPAPKGGATTSAQTASSTAADPLATRVLRWVPVRTELVIHIRTREMRSSSLLRNLMTSRPMFRAEMAHVDRLVAEAGLDLGRDVDSTIIATDGREGGEAVALLSGGFRRGSLTERLRKRGARQSECGDADCWVLAGGAAGSHQARPKADTIVAFPSEGTALVGSGSWVGEALTRMSAREAGGGPSEQMRGLIQRLDDKATIWSAAGGPAIMTKIRTEVESGPLEAEDLNTIRSVVASFWVTDDLRIDSVAATSSAGDAEMLALTIRGLAAMTGLRAMATDPDLAAAMRSLTAEAIQGGVRLRAEIPAQLVSRM